MKKTILLLALLVLIGTSFARGKIQQTKDGVYYQQFGKQGISYMLSYYVDPQTQQCFVTIKHGGDFPKSIEIIPCDKLAKNEEWKKILKWVKE